VFTRKRESTGNSCLHTSQPNRKKKYKQNKEGEEYRNKEDNDRIQTLHKEIKLTNKINSIETKILKN
jgi:hypothetical protein